MNTENNVSQPTPSLSEREKELIACVSWAINFCHTRGSGCVLRHGPKGEITTEHFVKWFVRALEPYGYRYDTDLLWYYRASKTDRKRMVKDNPALAEKLAAREAKP